MTTALLFLSSILYLILAVPPSAQFILLVTPLTFAIEQVREVLLWGQGPHWVGVGYYFIGSVMVAWLGLWWFRTTRRGVADVL